MRKRERENEMTFEPVKSGFNMASNSGSGRTLFRFQEALMGTQPMNGFDI